MAFNEDLADRIRSVLGASATERKMFGGLAFMVDGHMACGVLKDELMVRVGPETYDATVELPHARPMDFTRRVMRGFVIVAEEGLRSHQQLQSWVDKGVRFVRSLPPK